LREVKEYEKRMDILIDLLACALLGLGATGVGYAIIGKEEFHSAVFFGGLVLVSVGWILLITFVA